VTLRSLDVDIVTTPLSSIKHIKALDSQVEFDWTNMKYSFVCILCVVLVDTGSGGGTRKTKSGGKSQKLDTSRARNIWHPNDWLRRLDEIDMQAKGVDAYNQKRQLNIEVKNSNDKIFKSKHYDGITRRFNIEERFLEPNSLKIKYEECHERKPSTVEMTIEVIDSDCLEAALKIKEEGMNPVVLNMANAHHAGGGYITGASAQEEDLFRRSTYSNQLVTDRSLYPIRSESEAIYTPNVYVFRGPKPSGYRLLPTEECFEIDFIAVSADDRKKIVEKRLKSCEETFQILDGNEKNAYSPEYLRLLRPSERRKVKKAFNLGAEELKKLTSIVRGILKVAIEMNHDSIVLSALGCGAFCNPPEQVAQVFQSVLSEEFRNKFKKVVFAIFDDHNTGKAFNPEGNFRPFKRVFSNT